jgi:hypothetical protein
MAHVLDVPQVDDKAKTASYLLRTRRLTRWLNNKRSLPVDASGAPRR